MIHYRQQWEGFLEFSSLIETILLVKKLMKSSLLRVKGIHGPTELGLFVSLATVLKRNLGLFLLFSISNE